jgi:hypothetical protein
MNEITLFRSESTKNLYHEKTAELSVRSPFMKLYWLGLSVGIAIVISAFFLNHRLHS